MNKHKHKIITFAALMTAATAVVHFTNRTIAAAAQLKQVLRISNDKFFEWRFGNIYYTKKGTGSPVLLIHDTLPCPYSSACANTLSTEIMISPSSSSSVSRSK